MNKFLFLIFGGGLAALGIYEYTKNKSCQQPSGAGNCAPPNSEGGCLPGDGGCDGTGSMSGGNITSDPNTWPSGDPVWDVVMAVALAEGANHAGSFPDRMNNPCDLSKGDEHGQNVVAYQTNPDGEVAIQFATKQDGFNAAYAKFAGIRDGKSHVYSPSWTWAQVAGKYAGNSAAWLKNVTSALGVGAQDTFGSYFA